MIISESKKDLHMATKQQIRWLQREAENLAGYSGRIEKHITTVSKIIETIASLMCENMKEGGSFRVGFVRLQSVTVTSGERVKKVLMLIDQRGDTFTPPFPVLNCEKEGFFNNDPQSQYLFPPKCEHIVWFVENIAPIIHYLSHDAMHEGWEWDKFVGKFYDDLLSQNPLLKQILNGAEALAEKRWVKNNHLISYVFDNWTHVKTDSFQDAPDDPGITGHILNNHETWALVISDYHGREITFGTSQEEMQDKMYEVFF